MADPTNTTANMSLPLPIPEVTSGPDYALNNNSAFTIIDGHDHSSGKGLQVTPNGLDINQDLPFGTNNATGLRSSRYVSQASPLSTSGLDLTCVYASGGELWYNDGIGNQVQITQGGSVAGSTGTITGLPSGTASASYQSGSGTFVFQSSTSVAANIDAATYLLRKQTASSPAISLAAPSGLSGDYTLTLPATTAATSQSFITEDTSGNLSNSVAVDNATINIASNALQVKPGGIGPTQLASLSVGTANLIDHCVTAVKIANNVITDTQVAAGGLTGASIATNINLDGESVNAGGKNIITQHTNTTNCLQIMRGHVNTNGTVGRGEGFTCSGPAAGGIYTVTFSVAFIDVPVITTCVEQAGITLTAGTSQACTITSASTTGFTACSYTVNGGGAAVLGFNFIAIGQRV